jgi:hypothetical protein
MGERTCDMNEGDLNSSEGDFLKERIKAKKSRKPSTKIVFSTSAWKNSCHLYPVTKEASVLPSNPKAKQTDCYKNSSSRLCSLPASVKIIVMK